MTAPYRYSPVPEPDRHIPVLRRMNSIRRALLGLVLFPLCLAGCTSGEKTGAGAAYPYRITLSKTDLMDKIRGGWAGQVIGCTYGGPTEFDFNGTMIQEYVPIEWDSTKMKWWFEHAPGLYDDIYMDLTFVEVFEQQGLDAPAVAHANAFATADYILWHANQAARYNILNGIGPPESGHWKNNPHADDIDFQIEADFAGLMSPGMVNAASEVCDRVGHIMNYGDGWYGGVYVAAMYALSFVSDDAEFITEEALKTIPEESQFHRCIGDVIRWHREFPDDWKRTWFEVERNWSSDIGCPVGVFRPYNIDAKINAAYVVIGMLYGDGDFGKSLDISTRCGQDSDCNPASVGGIMGTMLGYGGIPEYWKQGLNSVEKVDFRYTTISLTDTYEMSFRHAVEMVRRNGGEEREDAVVIRVEAPEAVKLEQGFAGHFPVASIPVAAESRSLRHGGATRYDFRFNGKGFVMKGAARRLPGIEEELDLKIEVHVDRVLHEEAVLPTGYRARRPELTWKYGLEEGAHSVSLVWKNPEPGYSIELDGILVYGPAPAEHQMP